MEAAWNSVSGQLAIANGDEFERTALHYLRVMWPSMIQAPRMQHLDRFGVDLCVPSADAHFVVVIQAKGFKVDERLTESQVQTQVVPSIKKFHKSPLTCKEYVLLHNRDGSDRSLADIIQAALDELVRDGKTESAYLWDRSAFVKHVRNHLDLRIRKKLLERSQSVLDQQERFFHFGNLYVPNVPLNQATWKPGSTKQDDFDELSFMDTPVAKIIASPRKVRYALLIGSFGIGKTTTALHAAVSKEHSIVYVPAHAIKRDEGSQGTNYLLRNINVELDLLDDLPPDTSVVLNDVMGATLGRILRQPNDTYVLVIDGLDEHGFYGTPYGLQWLTNELSELRCSIVLTTRREHFLSLIGNYEQAIESLSKKGGAGRFVEILQLGTWSLTQGNELLQRAIELTANERQVTRIQELRKYLNDGSSSLAARLLNHPLFLQITLDLIMDGEEWLIDDEDALIEIWIRKKIQRDLAMPRLSKTVLVDSEYYVASMVSAMGRIAQEMQIAGMNLPRSAEVIDSERVVSIVSDCMGTLELDVSTILTTSLLIPASRRKGRVLEVKFFHRAFQEYFARRGKKAIPA